MNIKRILPLLVVGAGLLTLSSAASPAPAPARGNAVAPSSCDDKQAKAKLYQRFLDNFKGNVEQQKVAYETGKEYIAKYGDCPDEADKKVAAYVRKWLAAYEAAVREWERRRQ
ncbi:MAG TPA: hypothetical protein VN282_20595 [Pyrinomonadaceae bacterium]|nr:hypothetical protein [Pyrinomonadaceae bacterium]